MSVINESGLATDRWSLALLRELDWRVFESVCGEFFRKNGFDAEATQSGPDGGIDLLLTHPRRAGHVTGVQCKRYAEGTAVDVKQVREFFGVFCRDQLGGGLFITTSRFTGDAQGEFEGRDDFHLVDGEALLERIEGLSGAGATELLEFATESKDWYVPTCPSCEAKMVERRSKADESARPFWGCVNDGPKNCKRTYPMSAYALSQLAPVRPEVALEVGPKEPPSGATAAPAVEAASGDAGVGKDATAEIEMDVEVVEIESSRATPISPSPMVMVQEAQESKPSVLERLRGGVLRGRAQG